MAACRPVNILFDDLSAGMVSCIRRAQDDQAAQQRNSKNGVSALAQNSNRVRLLTLLASASLALSLIGAGAQAADIIVDEKPDTISLIGQKAPPATPAPDTPGDDFATVPGGNSGGLVFANLSDLRLLVAEVGSARMERDDNDEDYIAASIDGINYAVDVYNCDPDCADLTLTASFEMSGVTTDQMNEWNTTRRFGKAYIRNDGDAVIQIAINTRYGITVETFRDNLVWWETVLGDYVDFIGFR